jgi:receptor protein-tyrosine kinase
MTSPRRRAELSKTQEEKGPEGFSAHLVTIQKPESNASEAYRILRTNFLYSFADAPPKVIVLTSSGKSEGKSTVCANLGVSLAQAGKSSLIIDCDFRRPEMHTLFGLSNLQGLADVLVGRRSPEEVWEEPIAGLKVVTVGPRLANPTEALGARGFSEFLARIREEFDYVLIDAPPVGLVSEPAVLAAQGDGVILIVDVQNTTKMALRRAVRSLQAVGGNVLGTVTNNIKAPQAEHYYDYR